MKYRMKGHPSQVVEAVQVKVNFEEINELVPFELELVIKSGNSFMPLKEGCWIVRDTAGGFWSHTNDQFHDFYEELENV